MLIPSQNSWYGPSKTSVEGNFCTLTTWDERWNNQTLLGHGCMHFCTQIVLASYLALVHPPSTVPIFIVFNITFQLTSFITNRWVLLYFFIKITVWDLVLSRRCLNIFRVVKVNSEHLVATVNFLQILAILQWSLVQFIW